MSVLMHVGVCVYIAMCMYICSTYVYAEVSGIEELSIESDSLERRR